MFTEFAWFFFAVSAMMIYGVINFLYKVVAEHKLPSHQILHISAASVSALALLTILATQSAFDNLEYTIYFALMNSAFFAFGTITKIQSLKKIPSSLAFPVTKMNSVFLILYALVLFNEKPNFNQWIGIGISFAMLAYISFGLKNKNHTKIESRQQVIGLLLALLAAFSTSISMLTGKYASTEVPKLNYIFISYSFVMIYTLLINKTLYRSAPKPEAGVKKEILKYGIIIGFLNFVGYYFVLQAFATGPLSLVQGISSNSFVIPIILSIFVYKEKFTLKNAIIVLMAIVSVLLIK